MLFFLDTEFTDFIETDLISLALVSEDGTYTFYRENSEFTYDYCNSFVKAEVIPKLLKGNNTVNYFNFSIQLVQWLNQFNDLIFCATSPQDYFLLNDVIRYSGEDIFFSIGGIGIIQMLEQRKVSKEKISSALKSFRMMEEEYHQEYKQRHNALHDALAMQKAWEKTLEALQV